MTPERLQQLRLEAWGPGIADDMVALFDHIDSLQTQLDIGKMFNDLAVKERDMERIRVDRLLDERTKMNESWNDRCKVAELKLRLLLESSGRTPCSNHKGFKEDCGCP